MNKLGHKKQQTRLFPSRVCIDVSVVLYYGVIDRFRWSKLLGFSKLAAIALYTGIFAYSNECFFIAPFYFRIIDIPLSRASRSIIPTAFATIRPLLSMKYVVGMAVMP